MIESFPDMPTVPIKGLIEVIILFSQPWAFLEVFIEGGISWAALAPCPRYKNTHKSKELTAYHVSLGLTFFMAFEACARVLYGEWIPLGKLLVLLVPMLIAITLEDYSWHIINPSQSYGWRKTFVQKRYPAWKGLFICYIPIDYFLWLGGSLTTFLLLGGDVWYWLIVVSYCLLFALLLTITMPFVHWMIPKWGESVMEHSKKHVAFIGEGVKATVDVSFSDRRRGYTTITEGISPAGRINPGSDCVLEEWFKYEKPLFPLLFLKRYLKRPA
ncbi:MAG: hypothetical protein PHX30_01925 [Candidatus Pacebacteria bacterium]|nr:hypothetical protein [Candidatus Paceibacterota bacterium]